MDLRRCFNSPGLCKALWLSLMLLCSAPLAAQDAPDFTGVMELNFGGQPVDLKVLVDIVAKRLKMRILYDEQIGNQKITIKVEDKVPVASLQGLLESALKIKGLALIDADEPGWKRIDKVPQLPSVSKLQPAKDGDRPTLAVTQVVSLAHAGAQRVDQIIKPFLTTPGGNSIVVPEHDLLIVTDYATNVPRLERLIAMVDKPGKPVALEFVNIVHVEASKLSQQLSQLITAHGKARGADPKEAQPAGIFHDERTNRLALVDTPEAVEELKRMIRSLDVPLAVTTEIYRFDRVAADRVDRIVKELIGDLEAKRQYRSTIDKDANLLVVTASKETHAQIEMIRERLASVKPEELSPIRFYKLTNATATEVLETIRAIEGEQGLSSISMDGEEGGAAPRPATPATTPAGTTPPQASRTAADIRREGTGNDTTASASGVSTPRARVTADPNTNTIIVVADPTVQKIYEQLIQQLDRRRPQVLIEAQIIALDTSGGYELGVEVSRITDLSSNEQIMTFSSFGLSTVDANTGRLTLTPSLGFNGAMISADIADIVIKAIKTSGRGEILSSPKILVNDNATGTLTAVQEAPFTSVNASNTVSTTSFGGFASAGTTISATPRISEGDHLKLEYAIELSSFTGTGGGDGSIPPPRQQSSVASEVMIPDGHTIVIGGLKRRDMTETISRIPILGEIPIIEYFFSSRQKDENESSLFVFIKPTILRDDQFRDLKYLSRQDAGKAGLKDDLPESKPLIVR